MLNLVVKYKKYLIGIALGALAGFLYWRFVGCSSGTCPITSKWYNSAAYGALIGILMVNTKKKDKKEEKKDIVSKS